MLTQQRHTAGDPMPPECEVIEVHVAELRQLFNAIDPSPYRERDLDPNTEEFIVGWAREARRDVPFALVVHLDRPAGLPEEPAMLREAIHAFFHTRSQVSRRRLRQLFRVGRTNLLIESCRQASELTSGIYTIRTGITAKRSASLASARMGHQFGANSVGMPVEVLPPSHG